MSGSSEARFLRELDDTALHELEEFVFSRLKIVEQASKRSPETLVLVIWEVPFHWQLESSAVEHRWQEWCAKSSVPNAILFPVGPFVSQLMFATAGARDLVP